MNRIATLIEEAQDLASQLDESDNSEKIKAYANVAVVAETLSERFSTIAESVLEVAANKSERELGYELAEYSCDILEIAEEAASSAETLFESDDQGSFTEDVDEDKLEEHFADLSGGLLEALEVYAELTEDEDPS